MHLPSAPRLSVVIPTHRRPATLAACLNHLSRQTIVQDLEVIVVSDGHDDQTARLFEKAAWPFQHRFFEVPKSQQGVARNAGVAEAKAPYVLFINDDIFLKADTCQIHLESHESRVTSHEYPSNLVTRTSSLVLGHTTWDPAVGITPVMRWLELTGWQFGYPMIRQYAHRFVPSEVQHRFTYASHISLPTNIARQFPFRTDVTLYGWEDTEWGLRLKNAVVQLFYEPNARALHHHRITLEDSLKRAETLGRSVQLFDSTPGFDRRPHGFKLLLYRLAALFPTIAGRHRQAFLRGLEKLDVIA